MIRRIILLLAVSALLVLALAVPTLAASDVEKPPEGHNFGQCHKKINQGGNVFGITDNSDLNAVWDPWDPRTDKGDPRRGIACEKL